MRSGRRRGGGERGGVLMGGLWGVKSDPLVIRGGTGKLEYDNVLLVYIPAQFNSGIAVVLCIKMIFRGNANNARSDVPHDMSTTTLVLVISTVCLLKILYTNPSPPKRRTVLIFKTANYFPLLELSKRNNISKRPFPQKFE